MSTDQQKNPPAVKLVCIVVGGNMEGHLNGKTDRSVVRKYCQDNGPESLFGKGVAIRFEIYSRVDSKEVTPKNRVEIAALVHRAVQGQEDGVFIVHGADTAEATAEVLRNEKFAIPVTVVSSNKAIYVPNSDGPLKLGRGVEKLLQEILRGGTNVSVVA